MSQHKTELWDEALGGALSAKYNDTAEYVPVVRSVNARLVEEIAPFRRQLVDGFEKFLTGAKGKIDYYGPSLEQFALWIQPNGNFKKTDYDIAVLSHTHTHFFWQYTRAEFEFEEEVMAHIIESETPTKIPATIIKQLPYWTQWVRAPIGVDIAGEPAAQHGANLHFFGALVSYLRYDNKTFLNLNAPVYTEREDWKDPMLMAANVRVCIDDDIDFTDPNTIIPYMQGTAQGISEEMKQKIFGAVREWAPSELKNGSLSLTYQNPQLWSTIKAHGADVQRPNKHIQYQEGLISSVDVGQLMACNSNEDYHKLHAPTITIGLEFLCVKPDDLLARLGNLMWSLSTSNSKYKDTYKIVLHEQFRLAFFEEYLLGDHKGF
ncbi:hypothetical protein D5P86_00090 [Salmonella enterica subsp. enterica serovar Infantis]|nr:hypothetical protein [Salmonella enterica subsp. enterica serovar Infantis]